MTLSKRIARHFASCPSGFPLARLWICALSFIFSTVTLAHAETYYLDPLNGSDAYPGTSHVAAWKTHAHALSVLQPQDTLVWLDEELSNNKSGISLFFEGRRGVDWEEEYLYHDTVVDDHKIVYIKADTHIAMAHNARNMCQNELTNRFDYNIGINGENHPHYDTLKNVPGFPGLIRYCVDRDLQFKYTWSALNAPAYPAYEGPFSFAQLTYHITDNDPTAPVLGRTGWFYQQTNPQAPDYLAPNTPNLRTYQFHAGVRDQFGDEWHTIAFADDDGWVLEGLGSTGNQERASDGKALLFVVNPRTPCIKFKTAAPSAQFYTTPAKAHWIPKVHPQTTYLTDNVEISLVNIMGPDVYYRFDGQPFALYQGPISSNALSQGAHTLEYYYDSNHIKTRTIVKNPDHPSRNEDHGHLLVPSEDHLQAIRERVFSTSPEREPFRAAYASMKDDVGHDFADNCLRQGQRFGFASQMGGIINNANFPLNNAFVAVLEGVDSSTGQLNATGQAYAKYAKQFMLDNCRTIDPLWFGDNPSTPNPCPALSYRGYWDVDVIFAMAFAYDLLIDKYSSQQCAGGITPIEDYRIRDTLARFSLECMMELGGHGWYYYDNDKAGMWGSAREIGALVSALAMPDYHTSYYGTSGFAGNHPPAPFTPYPDEPRTWRYVFFENSYPLVDTPDLPGYPNQHIEFGFTGDPMLLRQDTLRLGNPYTCDTPIAPAGSFRDRIAYFSHHLMGHCFYILANVAKSSLDHTYPDAELAFEQASGPVGLYGGKVTALTDSDCPPRKFPQSLLVNHRFPNLAPFAHQYLIDQGDFRSELIARRPYSLAFTEDNWQEILTGDPVAQFSASALGGPAPLETTFDASTSRDCDGQIVSYQWNLGDGANASGKTVTHTYDDLGQYMVQLTVTDNSGKTATQSQIIIVDDSIEPDLVLYVPLDGTAGDFSLFGTTGLWQGGDPAYEQGKKSLAGSFDGDRSLSYGTAEILEGMQQLAISAWVRPDQLGGYHNIVSKQNDAYRLRLTPDGSIWYYLKNQDGQTRSAALAQKAPLGQWTHVALSYDGTRITVYYNGAAVHTVTWSGAINAPQADLVIGDFNGSGSEAFIGLIDDVRIYRRPLAPAEVNAFYQNHVPPVADAGQDQQVVDADWSGAEPVTLDASASYDPDGSIVSYVWKEASIQLATGVSPTVSLPVGPHDLTLTVADNHGLTNSDTIHIIVSQPIRHTITTQTGSGGSISPVGPVNVYQNGSAGFTITPNAGYAIANVLVDGASVGPVSTYQFTNVTANHTIAASFSVAAYTINASASAGGSISPTGSQPVSSGGSRSFTITPSAGYTIADVLVDGASIGAASSYEFTNITASHTIAASFSAATYSITASASSGGSISPGGAQSVGAGGSQSFSITPSAGYAIADVLVDGASVGAVSSYQFTNITANHTIAASFSAATYTITASAATGGSISPSGEQSVAQGGSFTFTITPDTGYAIAGVIVDHVAQDAITSYAFDDIAANHIIHATFIPVSTHTITASASSGGAIDPVGDIAVNDGGQSDFTITPAQGYVIANVLVDGASVGAVESYGFSDVSADHTIEASFIAASYTVTVSASLGGSIEPAGDVSVTHGENLPFTITPDDGFRIADVLVDGVSAGPIASHTFHTIEADHTIAVTFERAYYTILTQTLGQGQVDPLGPLQLAPGNSAAFTFQPAAHYRIADVRIDGTSHGPIENITFDNLDSNHTLQVLFAQRTLFTDLNAPRALLTSPRPDSIQANLNSLVILQVVDSGTGVDPNSVRIHLDDKLIYQGPETVYHASTGICRRTGTKADYTFTFQPTTLFSFDHQVRLQVTATDLAGNTIAQPYTAAFTTLMRDFGGQRSLAGRSLATKGAPRTLCDPAGNIWAIWHAGQPGARDIYLSCLPFGARDFDEPRQLTTDPADQCNPDLLFSAAGDLCAAWQDNARGLWDVRIATSPDGLSWSQPRSFIEDPQTIRNQQYPVLALADAVSNRLLLAWQDDRAGNQDIYAALSYDNFATYSLRDVTRDSRDQVQPAVASANPGNVILVWTDMRNGNPDLYATSLQINWNNVPLVRNTFSQTQPALICDADNTLHVAWTDDSLGDPDIFYATSHVAFPVVPIMGASVVDDTTQAHQTAPAICLTYSGSNTTVALCWQDARNLTPEQPEDYDLYFTEKVDGVFGANVLVTNEPTNAAQREPAMVVGSFGHPYILWVDQDDTGTDVVCRGATFIEDTPLATATVQAGQPGLVGCPLDQIQTADDVSVDIPAGAFWTDVDVTIARVCNAPTAVSPDLDIIARYEFGPSSDLEFAKPVTITIPYDPADFGQQSVYWHDPLTGTLSQSGLSNVEHLVISPDLHAIRFKTTHFTEYVITLPSTATSTGISDGGAGGGGGCSLAPIAPTPGNIAAWALPYFLASCTWLTSRVIHRRPIPNA